MLIKKWLKFFRSEKSKMIKILLAGEGGQGVQTVAKVITEAAQSSGRKTSYIPSFGVEQRGGVSLAYIRIGDQSSPYPKFNKADIIVCFCDRAVPVIKQYLTENTFFIYDNSAISDEVLAKIKEKVKKYLGLPAQKIAQAKYSTKVLNMIMLGALASQLKEITFSKVEEALFKTLGAKLADENIKRMNLGALHEGAQFAEEFDQTKTPFSGAIKKEIQKEFSDDKKTWTCFPEYCKGCSLCITRCPVKALQFSEEIGFLGNQIPKVDLEKCIACSLCEKNCPDGAIKVDKK